MTEERRKYLSGVGKEELNVRRRIAELKYKIVRRKRSMARVTKDVYRVSSEYFDIKEDKIIIKALKKHLPQYLYLEDEEYFGSWRCPICKYRVLRTCEEMDFTRCYCPSCGQKLLGKNPAY